MSTLIDKEKRAFSPPELGCVFYLPGFPGASSKIYDRSPYGNIGTITGATWKKLPSGLWALDFDGSDDYVNCGAGASLDISEYTLEAWIKFSALVENQVQNIFRKMTDDSHGFLMLKDNSGNYLYINAAGNVYKALIASTYTLVTDVWYHAVGVFKQSTYMRIYANGNVIAETTSGIPAYIGSTAAQVLSVGHSSQSINGCVALPRIYNQALSALEIQNHFNREKHLFGV